MEAALQERFKGMSTEELLAEHQSGRLADWAYTLAEQEISSRHVAIPSRPEEFDAEPSDKSFFSDHWSGKRSLGSAFWRIYVIGGKLTLLAIILIGVVIKNFLSISPLFLLLLLPIYFFFSTICVWRCAINSKTPWLAWLARGFTVLYSGGLSYGFILSFAK